MQVMTVIHENDIFILISLLVVTIFLYVTVVGGV